MDVVWIIWKVLVEEDREECVAVFTNEDKANDAINRLRLRDEANDEVDYNMRPCNTDPTSEMLELPKTLREMGCDDLLNAARIELCNNGTMYVPLWVNPAWLVHELKAKYNLGIDFRGREMTLVLPDEVKRRREFGIQDENAPSDFGYADAGFVETKD